jgi:hypothetical protein
VPGTGTLVNVFPQILASTLSGDICDVDLATGVASNCRNTGLTGLFGITYNSDEETLYGVTNSSAVPPNTLYRFSIDEFSAVPTAVATLPHSPMVDGDITYHPNSSPPLYLVVNWNNPGAEHTYYRIRSTDYSEQGFPENRVNTIDNLDAIAYGADDTMGYYFLDTSSSPARIYVGGNFSPPTPPSVTNVNLGTSAGMTFVGSNIYIIDGGLGGTNRLYSINMTISSPLYENPPSPVTLTPVGNLGFAISGDASGIAVIP